MKEQNDKKSKQLEKHDEGKVLERGILADEPGFRIPKHRLGRGKEGGGWCTVM